MILDLTPFFPSLEALIRPLPHYGRQSYIAFDGREAIEKGIWPMRVQQVMADDGCVPDCEGVVLLRYYD